MGSAQALMRGGRLPGCTGLMTMGAWRALTTVLSNQMLGKTSERLGRKEESNSCYGMNQPWFFCSSPIK